MALKITPIAGSFAAEASGLDLSKPIDPQTAGAIEAAMDQHAVLVWRGQPLDQDQQMAFTAWFGPLQVGFGKIASTGRNPRLKHAAMGDISNLDDNGEIAPRNHKRIFSAIGNMVWHSDSSFQRPAAKYSILTAHTLPSWGGETEFADMRAAYDGLDERSKAMIDGLFTEH